MSIDPFEGAIPSDLVDESHPHENPTIRYAGFWIRFAASIIDSILVMIVILPIFEFFFGNTSSISSSLSDSSGFSSYNFESISTLSGSGQLLYFLTVLAVVILFWIYRSATPGKMLLGLKIINAKTGGAITKRQGIVRYLGYYVSTLFFALGFIWAGFDRRKQGWHDKMAGTLVIYNDKTEKSPD